MAEGYTYKVPLLSKGKLYDGGLKELEFRKMKIPERVILSSAKSPLQKLRAILKNCLVSPVSFDIDSLLLPDAAWCIMHIRAESISPQFTWNAQCPHCGQINKVSKTLPNDLIIKDDIDLDNIVEPFEVEANGNKYGIKFLRMSSQIASERNRNTNPQLQEDELVTVLAMRLDSINGDHINYREAIKHIKEMDYMPSMNLTDAIEKQDFGSDLEVMATCEYGTCGLEFKTTVAMGAEFFRPTEG